MSRYIASRAIRGAHLLVNEADDLLKRTIAEHGPDAPVAFPNTAYYLPTINGMMGVQVETLGQLEPVLKHARSLLHPMPSDCRWMPYLGETLDSGMATLFAAEAIEAVRFVRGEEPQRIPGFTMTGGSFTSPDAANPSAASGRTGGGAGSGFLNGPIDDVQLRSWGIALVDGRMPGFAAIVGCAKSNEVAVKIVRELQRRNILIFLSGNVNGRSIIHQLQEEGVEMGYDTYIVPFGLDTLSAIYALGFATRSALTFGGLKAGQAREILLYNRARVFAFVLALGEIDDLKYAAAAGAINYGFPVIADTVIPQILPTGVTQHEHVVSLPFNTIAGKDDQERAEKLVQKCIETRGVKIKITEVPVPVPYGSAFEGEVVRKKDMRVEFGGKYSRAFEYLRMVPLEQVEDGRVEVLGPDFAGVEEGGYLDLGILIEVAGRKMQKDFEPVLERQVHYFINGASGVQHIGQRDIAWIRIAKAAADKGFTLEHFGKILHARFHGEFGAIVDKVQVKIITDPAQHAEWLQKARDAYAERNERMGSLVDESVDEFYTCTLCVPAGEEIVLADGSFMPVEQLLETVVEDRDLAVASLDECDLAPRPVGELFINPAPEQLVRITLTNGNMLTLTANHKLLTDTPDGLQWVAAGKIGPDTIVVDSLHTERMASPDGPRYIVDFLPDDYQVTDDAWLRGVLKPALLTRYGGYNTAAGALGIPYDRLYTALYERDDFSHQRLTMGELRHIIQEVGLDWNAEKSKLRCFQAGAELKQIELDKTVMYAAGLVAADGSVRWRGENGRSGGYVQFTNTEWALVERFSTIMAELFGERPKLYAFNPKTAVSGDLVIESKRSGHVVEVHNTLFCRLMVGLGIGEIERKTKWRGEVISTLPVPLIAAFVRGLFDGDGHVAAQRAFVTTRTHREAQHLHLLLKKLGIASYITEITRGYQVGTRANGDLERFRTLIGAEHPAKANRLAAIELTSDAQHVVRTDGVPLYCGRLLKDLTEAYGGQIHPTKLAVDYKTWRAWLDGGRRASKEKLSEVLDGLAGAVLAEDPIYKELRAWTKSDLRFERVKQVEWVDSGDTRVYNFSVLHTHNYLVNGVIVKNCQSFAPTHVCIVSPERLGLCGAYNWLDCKASFEINPTGPNQPIRLGDTIDPVKGYWTGTNDVAVKNSQGTVQEVAMYSIMTNPMTACGCFECIVMLIPEANGVMVVSREDTSMTPAGMTFSTLAGMAGGGLQTPGVMGVGKYYLTSPKFISADGGFKRVVWMSSVLKRAMGEEWKAVAEREGDPDLLEKIADETICTDVDGLMAWMEEHEHPALFMDPIF